MLLLLNIHQAQSNDSVQKAPQCHRG
jgi:carbonic anhydrase